MGDKGALRCACRLALQGTTLLFKAEVEGAICKESVDPFD